MQMPSARPAAVPDPAPAQLLCTAVRVDASDAAIDALPCHFDEMPAERPVHEPLPQDAVAAPPHDTDGSDVGSLDVCERDAVASEGRAGDSDSDH